MGGGASRSAFEYLSEAVSRHFKVHHIEGDRRRLAFFTKETKGGDPVVTDSDPVDRAFDDLRIEIKQQSYVATLQLADGVGVVTVSRVVDPLFRSSRVNMAFLILTLVSVQSAGALLWAGYISPHGPRPDEPGVDWLSADAQLGGLLYFALPLMGILGLHEMGHFIMARHYHVRASLPFFIPSVPPLGTFGAFISMRDPLPSRRVIFDIGLSGPLVGFVASIGVTAIGSFLMAATPAPVRPEVGGGVTLGTPLLFNWLLSATQAPLESYPHPTLFAGWAGFLVTAFNLIPAAQLDGGHVFFSLIPNGPSRESRAIAISFAAVIGIAVLGSLLGYSGWLLLLFIVVLTIRHPPPLNQISKLGGRRLLAGLAAILVFAISFSPAPIQEVPGDYSFEVTVPGGFLEFPAGGLANWSFNITNAGNAFNELEVRVLGVVGPFNASFEGSGNSTRALTNLVEYVNRTVNVTVRALSHVEGEEGQVYLHVWPVQAPHLARLVTGTVRTVAAHPAVALSAGPPVEVAAGGVANITLTVTNAGDVPLNLTVDVADLNGNWSFGFGAPSLPNLTVALGALENTTVSLFVRVSENASAGEAETFEVRVEDPSWPGVRALAAVEVRSTG